MNKDQRIKELEAKCAVLSASNEDLSIKLKKQIGARNFLKAKLEGRVPARINIARLENGQWGVFNASVLASAFPDFMSANAAAKQLATTH